MRKLLLKFTSIIITLSVLMSVVVILPVSATEEDTEELITNFSGVPLETKAKLYTDEGLKYKYNFLYRNVSGQYTAYFINDITNLTDTQNIDNISYFNFFTYYQTDMYTSDNATTYQSYWKIYFDEDGIYTGDSGGASASIAGYNDFYGYSTATDKIQNAVDNIIYSDFDVKYNSLTVYQTSNNKAVSIADIIELGAGDGTGEIVGPQKLPTDYQLYGTYMDKNEETWEAFIQWLIANEYYTELATYGLTATADNIQSLANTWWDNRFSATLFWNLVKTNGVNTLKNAENIIAWFSAKWQQYINHNYVKVPVGEEANSDPHHRAELMTDKTDDEGNIIDTTDISLLREIVRQLETLPLRISSSIYGVLYPLMSNMADNIYSLCLMVGNLPEYTANAIYNNFVDSINLILNAIDNINSDSPLDNIFDDFYNKLLSVFIPDSEYMTSWENDVTGLIDSKFGFIGQLADLQQIINTYCFGTEQIVNYASVDDGQLEFDEYMNYPSFQIPAFDAGFISSKEPITIIDWSIIDEYRIYLHQIIVAVCYVTFISRKFKRTPNMIANNDIAD